MDPATYKIEAEIEASHWWFKGRRRLFSDILRGLDLPKDARILDVGTGTGANLRMLRDLGFTNVTGIDNNDLALEFCRQKGLGPVDRGDICHLPFPDGNFDVTLVTDILEHVEDDGLALAEIHRVLDRGGKAIITVPAFPILWGLQDRVSQHKRRYRMAGLVDRVKSAGLVCRESFHFNYVLFLPILIARSVIRWFKLNLKSENLLNTPVLNSILTGVFGFDVVTSRRLSPPFGVSILILAERPPQ